jgi:PAS domain S-box-containing protein
MAAVGALAVFTTHAALWPAPADGGGGVVVYAVFPAIYVLGGALCFARAAIDDRERTAWFLFGLGQLLEAFGWLSYDFYVRHLEPVPYPSPSDAGWLGGYVLYLCALLSLLRARLGHLRVAPWLDGPVAALATAAFAAGFVVDGVIAATGGSTAAIAVSVGYPVVDLIFLVLLAVVFAVNRWRPSGVWLGIAGAIAAQVVVDTLYLRDVAAGDWRPGTVFDAGWGLAGVLIGVAAWLPRPPREQGGSADSLLVRAVPTVFTVAALALVIYDHFDPLSDVAIVLASLALVVGALRSATSYAAARSLASQKAALEQTASILRAAGEGIYMIDPHGLVTYANPAAGRMLGYTPEELVGLNMHETAHHKMADGSRHRIEECPICATTNDGRERRVTEDVFWRNDGRPVPVEYTVTPIREDGVIAGAAIVFGDVTARRRAERDDRARHAVARVIAEAETLDDGRAGILRAIGTAMGFRAAAGWVVGGEPTRMLCASTWAADDHALPALAGLDAAVPDSVREALASGRVVYVQEICPDAPADVHGELAGLGCSASIYVPIVYSSKPIGVMQFLTADGNEPDASMLATLEAIGAQVSPYSARRRAEAEADRAKDEFFALVSHELRTPLTSIVGYLELVREDTEVDDHADQFLSVVERNSKRLLRLVGDLLFVAQVGGANALIEAGTVDLPAVAAEAVEAARPRARATGVDLVLATCAMPPIEGDAGRIGQAIDNLVSNAIKFTPDGGRVVVALRNRGDVAIIEVSDTGIGISGSDQQHLFERFFRASSATKRAIQGVGLGLTIVKAIVEGHGGSIDVESAEGEGTTFRASLPLRPAAAPVSTT